MRYIAVAVVAALLGVTTGSAVGLSTHSHLIGWVACVAVVAVIFLAARRGDARRAADDNARWAAEEAQAEAEERDWQGDRYRGDFAGGPGMPSYDI